MFGRSKEEPKPEMVAVEVDVETYALSSAADRLRKLEHELHDCFEEWSGAQKSSAEKSVLVEFKMTPWLGAAWSTWRAEKYTAKGGSDGETAVIDMPPGWPE